MPQSAGEVGYSPTIDVPTAPPGGDLPSTGMDVSGPIGLGAAFIMLAVVILAAINGRRLAHPTPEVAPSYLRDKSGRDPYP